MNGDILPEGFDELVGTGAMDDKVETTDRLGKELEINPDLLEVRNQIRDRLSKSDAYSWRGGDEIEAFVEGWTAATILLNQNTEIVTPTNS